MNKKSWIIFAIIVVAIVGGMVYISTQNRLNISDINNDQLSTAISAESRNGNIADHEIGSKDAKVTIIEYADYQCIARRKRLTPIQWRFGSSWMVECDSLSR